MKLSNIKEKFIQIKEKYHPWTNYKRIINGGFKEMTIFGFILIVFYFFSSFKKMTKIEKEIMQLSNPESMYIISILLMLIFLVSTFIYRKVNRKNILLPHYKKLNSNK